MESSSYNTTSGDWPIPKAKIDLMKNILYDFTKPIAIGNRLNEPFQFFNLWKRI